MVGAAAQRHSAHRHWPARLRQPVGLGHVRRHLHADRRHLDALVRIQRSAGRAEPLAADHYRCTRAGRRAVILWEPALGGITLTYVIAAWAIIGGILTIISALRLREEIDNEWWLVLSGILAIIFGILVFTGRDVRWSPGHRSGHRLGVWHLRHRGGHPVDRSRPPGAGFRDADRRRHVANATDIRIEQPTGARRWRRAPVLRCYGVRQGSDRRVTGRALPAAPAPCMRM